MSRKPARSNPSSDPSSDLVIIRRLLGYVRGETGLLLIILGALVVSSAGSALGPTLIARALDEHIVAGNRAGLTQTMLVLLAVYLVSNVAFAAQYRLMGHLAQRVLLKLRSSIFKHLQRLSLSFYHNNPAGDLMSRLVNDTDTIGTLFSQSLTQALGSVFSLFAILIAMFALDWRLALATCAVLPIMIFLTFYFSRRSRQAYRRARKALGELSAELEENLGMIRESQAFARTAINVAHFETDNAENRDANVEAARITAAFSPTIDVLSTLARVIVVGFGGYLAFNGAITVGVVVAFLSYSQQFFRPVQMLANLYTQLQATLAASERIFDLLDNEPEIQNKQDAQALPSAQGHVVFQNVDFAYTDKPILKDFMLNVQAGETIAFVGETGAGKSTAMNLIGRFYDVNAGHVLIDGIDVRDVTLVSLREQIAEVPQSSFLFNDSIANNIRYGQPDADLDAVMAAAKAARAHDFIEALPNGYASRLGSEGISVSQGQRQLLCIARAILADPRLLLLDEATANIDTRTEQLVQEAIDDLLDNRTAFVVAHRLSTIRHADQIVVIGEGGILEQGNHEALMSQDGYYANLINRQSFVS
ncbi:MAG: ABC transporter ATP-binding protein [Deinococcota bacterium]